MDVPLIIDGERRGSVSFMPDGLYTVAEASLAGDPGKLVRLWAQGGGESAYLGLMQPWSEGLYLRRRLSRRDLEAFPKTIEAVTDGEDLRAAADETAPEKDAAVSDEIAPEEAAVSDEAPHCPWPAEVTEQAEGLLWLRRTDGTLTAHDGVSGLVALPAALRSAPDRAVLRRIEGKDYLVFRT